MSTTRIISTLLLCLLCCGGASAQAPQRLHAAHELAERFQTTLEDLYAEAQTTGEHFPGAIAAFMLPDGRRFVCATGFSDIEQAIPMTSDLRMPSGSIGKTYVAAVAMHLAQRGLLGLDEKVAKWLADEPWYARVPNAEALTLRALLSHTGGLLDHVFASDEFAEWAKSNSAAEDAYLRPRQVVEFVLDTEPLFEVGGGYSYTDTGYVLAGIAIEKATGRRYYDLLSELVLQPLSLQYTAPADRRRLAGLAQGYAHESAALFGTPLKMIDGGAMVIHPLTEWTGGGLVNNPQDMVLWAKALYEGEVVQALDELLRVGFVEHPQKPNDGYGLGVYVAETAYGLRYGHGGFYPGYNSQMMYFPDYRVAVALQINSDKTEAARYAMTLSGVVIDALAGLQDD